MTTHDPARDRERVEDHDRAGRDAPRRGRPARPRRRTARSVLGADLPLIADDVTVEHLLAHRSGIGDYLDEDVLDPDDYPMPVSVHRLATTEDFLPILDGHPTKFPAGERLSYCNGGYVVLALIAERVAGRTYHDLVRELVLAPAGMADSDFLRSDDLPGSARPGTSRSAAHWRTNVFHLPVLATGDGGMYTTSRRRLAVLAGAVRRRDRRRRDAGDHAARPQPDRAGRGPGATAWASGCGRTSSEVTISGADAGVSFASQHDPERRLHPHRHRQHQRRRLAGQRGAGRDRRASTRAASRGSRPSRPVSARRHTHHRSGRTYPRRRARPAVGRTATTRARAVGTVGDALGDLERDGREPRAERATRRARARFDLGHPLT